MIFHWPPVGIKAHPVWTLRQPVRRSRSLLTGARYISAHERPRLHAELSVSAMSKQKGAGYMEALKRLLAGGEHLVRLWHRPQAPDDLAWRAQVVDWYKRTSVLGAPVTWYEGGETGEVMWYTAKPYSATPVTDGLTGTPGFPAVEVTGLPPNVRVIVPGEYVRIIGGGEQRLAINESWSDSTGKALIRYHGDPFSAGGDATLGEPDWGVFEPTVIPDGGGPLNSDYTYDWTFDQVFPDEFSGTQIDVPGWWREGRIPG